MRKLVFALPVLLFLASCGSSGGRAEQLPPPPVVDDLEMTPELQEVYAARREALLDIIGDNALFIRSDYGYNGGRHEYRVASNFWYLTGYGRSGAVASLSASYPEGYSLYVSEPGFRDLIYSGDSPGEEQLMAVWGADRVMSSRGVDRAMAEVLRSGQVLYIDYRDQTFRSRVLDIAEREKVPAGRIRDVGSLLSEMRVIKDEHEVAMLQKAVDITGKGIVAVMDVCRPGMFEFEMEALLEYVWRRNGSAMPGFNSIVGSGKNAVILHYGANSRMMEDGDLLLMDLGAEYAYYTADISRTIPVNGRFSREQKDIYELVLKAQKAAIDEMMPGSPMTGFHRKATEVIMDGLYELGLVTDPSCQWQRKFYTLYHIFHYLGLDVHDVGDAGIPASMRSSFVTADTEVGRPLEKGMVLTVEPGIYLRANGLDQLEMLYGREAKEGEIEAFIEKVAPVYEKYKNIGVRIEDDVLITENGNVVLSAAIPKEVADIERLMRHPAGTIRLRH